MPIRRWLIIYAVVALSVPLGYFYLQANPDVIGGTGEGTAGADSSTPALQYHIVGIGEVISVVSAVGAIEADEVVNVSATVPGRVVEVYAQSSDYVEEGDLLLRLVNDDQRIAYDRALLNLELAQIELADLTGPPDGDDVRIAQANVDAAWGSYRGSLYTANPAQIQAAELQVQQAQAQLDTAIEQRVFGGGFDNEEEIALADAQVGSASFNLEISRLRLTDLQTGNYAAANAAYYNYLQAEAELARVLAGPTDIAVEQAEVRVEQAQAQLQSAELALSRTEIRAPFAGFVGDVLVEPGSLVSPGVPLVVMVDTDPLGVTVQIDEIDIGQIEPGMPVRVEIDALPDTLLQAKMEKISLTGRQTSGGIVNYNAEVQLLDVNPIVRVGMTAEANIVVDQVTDVVVVPNAYVRLDRRTNEAFVQVVNANNELEERQITLGLRGQQNSEVVSGLSEGDIVAADLTGTSFSLFGG